MQDKGYLLVNVQLPDAASVERTERVMHRIEELAHKTPGVKHTVAIAGQSILLGANAPNFGAMYVMLDDFHRRAAPRPLRRRHRRPACRPTSRQEIKDGLVNVFGRPAGRRPGHRRRLQDHRRGPRRQRPAGLAGGRRKDRRRRPAAIPALQGLFSSFRADTPWLFLDIDRTQAKVHGRVDGRGLQHAASLPGLAVRQRLQPLRPHLAGERAGRRRLPQAGRGPQAAEGPQRPAAHGAAGARRQHPRHQRAGDDRPLQHVPGGAGQRRAGAGRQLRRGHPA